MGTRMTGLSDFIKLVNRVEGAHYLRVVVPLPPSDNNLYPSSRGGGRHRSAEYNAWLKHAFLVRQIKTSEGWAVPPKGHLLMVVVTNPINFTRDVPNSGKAAVDFLKKSKLITDDRWIQSLLLMRNQTLADTVIEMWWGPWPRENRARRRQ